LADRLLSNYIIAVLLFSIIFKSKKKL